MTLDHKAVMDFMPSYLEGELTGDRKAAVEAHLATCPDCRKEYEEMNKFERVMSRVALKSPPEEAWRGFGQSVYNRLERRIGWILLSLGAAILLFFGAFEAVKGLIHDPSLPLIVKAGILLALAGLAVLIVSLVRERYYVNKRERYKEIEQ